MDNADSNTSIGFTSYSGTNYLYNVKPLDNHVCVSLKHKDYDYPVSCMNVFSPLTNEVLSNKLIDLMECNERTRNEYRHIYL